MKQQILVTAMVLAVTLGLNAHAEKREAKEIGIMPQMGYTHLVNEGESCEPSTDIVTSGQNYPDLNGNYSNLPTFIRKCDGSMIGWVEISANGADLGPDYVTEARLNHSEVMLRLGDHPNQVINIYTCDRSRADEFAKEQYQQNDPFRDPKADAKTLRFLQANKVNFKIKLFYNEYYWSGKCIGGIKIVR